MLTGYRGTGLKTLKKLGVLKNPVPEPASLGGELNLRMGTGADLLKIGVTAVSGSYPSYFYYFNAPGFHDQLIIAFQPLNIPLPVPDFTELLSIPKKKQW
jgi:hypothetical protein